MSRAVSAFYLASLVGTHFPVKGKGDAAADETDPLRGRVLGPCTDPCPDCSAPPQAVPLPFAEPRRWAVEMLIGGLAPPVLLDTGAEVSCLSDCFYNAVVDAAKRRGDEVEITARLVASEIQGEGGGALKALLVVCLPVGARGRTTVVPFLVVRGLSFPAILGATFLQPPPGSPPTRMELDGHGFGTLLGIEGQL